MSEILSYMKEEPLRNILSRLEALEKRCSSQEETISLLKLQINKLKDDSSKVRFSLVDLPTELLELVVSFCPTTKAFVMMGPTCKILNGMSFNELLWKARLNF